MANKNTKLRLKLQRKQILSEGGFSKPVYKKKLKPFPTPNDHKGTLSMTSQAKFFNNPGSELGA